MTANPPETYTSQKLPAGADPVTTLASRPTIPLIQNWLPTPDPSFAPAQVATAWDENYLYIYAKLTDQDIFNPVTTFNQAAHLHGDIFEILIRSADGDAYFEFHITPNGQILQLRFPKRTSLAEFRESGQSLDTLIDTFKFPDRILEAKTTIEEGHWTVLAKVPARALMPNGKFLAGNQLLFSFCRYDHTRNQPDFILSSTSKYTVCSFHRQEEWNLLTLSD